MPNAIGDFRAGLTHPERLRRDVSLRPLSTLRAGGVADLYYRADTADELAEVVCLAQRLGVPFAVLGSGTNVLVADTGARGLVVHVACARIEVGETTYAECGAPFQELFLRTAQAGLSGLEFAVGIPGTVGGALVSNAGAYRSSIGPLIERLQVVEDGERKETGPEWLELGYRDSCLRRGTRSGVLLSVTLRPRPDDPVEIYRRAREFQERRRMSQPPGASAGSFFKNVNDRGLAERVPGLPERFVEAGVVPAAYLIEVVGMKGRHLGGAGVSAKHANFLMNLGGASASEIRVLAEEVKRAVSARFGVTLEEEVLYFGDWRKR